MLPIVYNLEPFGYSKNAINIWQSNGYQYVSGSEIELTKFEYFEKIEVIIVRLKSYIDVRIIDKLSNLKAVISSTTGIDHIDTKLLFDRNIKLVNLRPYKDFLDTIPSTAEHSWALLMSLVRKISAADSDVKHGNWNRDNYRGQQLKDKTIGILGLGRVGLKVANYARAFGMNVCYYDPFVYNDDFVKVNDKYEFARSIDILSIHVHLANDTRHLVNKEFIEQCLRGVYIINTSRGDICDENAIVEGLNTNIIKGFATDVLSTEVMDFSKSKIWKVHSSCENVIITPHIGGATWDAMWSTEEFLAKIYTELPN